MNMQNKDFTDSINRGSGFGQVMKKITDIREFMLFSIILIFCIFMSFASPYFLTGANVVAVLMGLALNSIVAVGMTVLLISGGFDMSVGSNLALSGLITAIVVKTGAPLPVCILAGIATGLAVGLLNGSIIAKIKINPFITTLATMMVCRGIVLVITNGQTISGLPSSFTFISQGSVFGIQYIIPIAVIVVILGDILVRRSRFFRQMYYIGGNEKSALLSGINVDKMRIFGYALCGALTGFAGVLMTARLGSASVTAGTSLEFTIITIVIIGGASLAGGEGTVFGSFLGAILMGLISNALTLFGVSVTWNQVVIGTTLLLAVMLDVWMQRRKSRIL